MNKLKVFYNEKQSVKKNVSFSPSAGKPEKVIKAWKKTRWLQVVDFKPLSEGEIALAHDLPYVRDILSLKAENGFGNRSSEVAVSLPWTTGSFVSAATYAYENKTVAISPTSGFHHAGYGHSGGFCTFNGLMIAAQKLFSQGAKKVGILDLDAHYGNGTVDIIRELKLENKIVHVTSMRSFEEIEAALPKFKDCDIILYQAGADPHENDPLGGGFTSEELRQRDRIVFEYAAIHGIPIAWNLAGGYQTPIQKVIDIHMATLEECYRIYGAKNE